MRFDCPVSATQRIGWGILATGHIASVFARDLALVDDARLVGVGSRSADKAEAFAAEHGATRAYGSYADLAADPEVDAVYVASTHNDHLESARLCLEAGKAVLVEKPLTTTPAETAALIECARDRGQFLMEAMWTRTHPLIRRLAEIAAAGEIGEIRHVAADFGFPFRGPESHRLLDPAQAGGAILDAGVYPAHAVHLFLGEPAELSAYGHHASDRRRRPRRRRAALSRHRPARTGYRVGAVQHRVPAAQPARGLRHRRPDHDRRLLPARRACGGACAATPSRRCSRRTGRARATPTRPPR